MSQPHTPRSRRRRRWAAVAAVAAVLVTACTNVDPEIDESTPTTAPSATTAPAGESSTTVPPPTFVPDPVVWSDCGLGDECATVSVPLDYTNPGGPRIQIALRKVPAGRPDQRIGSLLVNPGGPGSSGTDFVTGGLIFSSDIAERFDVIGFDPRGVGDSTAITCGGELVDSFLEMDPDPDDAAEQAELETAAQAIADDCGAENGDLLAHVGSRDVARDMESIRQALGEAQISYFGFSYGTLLGELYAEMFPAGARAIVLDGVVDPTDDFAGFLRGQAEGFERTMATVFSSCGAACPARDAEAAFDTLAEQLETAPLPAGGGEVTGPSELLTAAIFVTYSPGSWPLFYGALADGLEGDGAPLRALAEDYRSFGGFTAYAAVECVDSPHPTGSAEYQAFAAELEAISPRFGAAIANELLPCAFWPVPPVGAPAPITAPGAPPILVIGNTGDAATPYEQAQYVADTLATGHLLTYDGEGHTSYGSDPCVNDAAAAYLVDLALPAEGAVCG